MNARDEVIQHIDYSKQEVELIITDSKNWTLTQLFDEAVDMMIWSGLEYMNATSYYQCDENTKLELAYVEFDDEGKYKDGFCIHYIEDTLAMLKIKWK